MTIEGNVGSKELSATASPVWFIWKEGENLGEAKSVGSKQATMPCSRAFGGHP